MTADAMQMVLTPTHWPTFAFVITRVGGMMLAAPVWSLTGMPRIARAAVTVVIATALLPIVPTVNLHDSVMVLPLQLVFELMMGAIIGITANVFVQAVSLAGEVVAMQMGLSLAPVVSPMADVLVPGIGQLKTYLALMIYVSLDGHLFLLDGIADSLRAFPPGTSWISEGAVDVASRLFGTFYTLGLKAAAPAMVALFLVNIAVGITGRAVPQLNAILVLFPVTIGVGLIILGATIPILGATIAGWMSTVPDTISWVVGVLVDGGGR